MEREEWWREEAGTNILLVHTLKYEPKKRPKVFLNQSDQSLPKVPKYGPLAKDLLWNVVRGGRLRRLVKVF